MNFYSEPKNSFIKFDHVTVKSNSYLILDNVSANVPYNSWTCIIGPNGAGKTTLLLALLGEISYTGHIHINPTEVSSELRIGYVPQRFQFDRSIPLTTLEFLALGLERRPIWLNIGSRVKRKAKELLALVNAEHLYSRALGALSGGELQRVLLALFLSRDPNILILDEPSSGVDPQGDVLLCELLEQLKSYLHFTLLMVTHDLFIVRHHADHVICLKRRVITEGEPTLTLNKEVLLELFGLHTDNILEKYPND